jgi:hypothetical protein
MHWYRQGGLREQARALPNGSIVSLLSSRTAAVALAAIYGASSAIQNPRAGDRGASVTAFAKR